MPSTWSFARRVTGSPAVLVALSTLGLAAPVRAHEGTMHIGRSDSGVITFAEFNFNDLFTLPSASLPLAGWASETPGFEAIEGDDPAAGLYALDTAAKISIEVISFSPALKLWNHELDHSITAPGSLLSLGALPFTEHTTWHIDASDPGFDPLATEWTASFRLIDTGSTAYAPSEPQTLHFTTIPAPMSVIALAPLATRRRRRAPSAVPMGDA